MSEQPPMGFEDYIRIMLADTLPGEQTDNWLDARNTLLDGQRPRDLLASGRTEKVLRAAERFVDGDPI